MELNFKSYEDLECYLKDWSTFDKNERLYDAVGITVLLNACIENLRKNNNYFDPDEISGIISEENKIFLKLICLS